ncbi:MAG: oligosaccharide flippase family protein [Candidatus Marinimicrobia bacterium]|nr:oligosaccharide flippase family protein [Candidatus Neomarinimicrobiota bacterium]MBT4851026.1 oligosaccharide flippase family protein [Candidatus Neomarinimicrobiota bacterium]MBT6713618.1 oligosaccharide flippase family protein [Candidatus Neomarinimicrobiota bacterium]MBT7021623.1 oligosaccharide flippase family protein [Candidatus Neomarinimicrobiota bacterium]MBT7884646.1 oligosaccharide flippase family protein [Candidatus Neomarinimicrobiota bacterium]
MNNVLKSVLTLASGNLINQAILLLTYPIISRIYSPEDFGTFEQVNAILIVFIMLGSLRYETAIIVSKDETESRNTLVLSSMILIILTMLIFFLLIIFSSKIASWLSNPKLGKFLLWMVPLLFMAGMQQIFFNWTIRNKNINQANLSNIFKSSINSIGRVVLGLFAANPISLFVSRFTSYFLSFMALFIKEMKEFKTAIIQKEISGKSIRNSAIKHKEFPLFMSGGVIFNRMATSITPLMLSGFFGVRWLGFYAMANTALNIPIAILRSSLQTVFLQEMFEKKNSGTGLFKDLVKITSYILILGIIPLIVIIVFGPSIFSFVLGPTWETSGIIASFIITWLFVSIVNTPSIALIPVLKIQRYFIIFQAILFVTRIAILLWTNEHFGSERAVLLGLVAHGCIFNIFNMIYVFSKTFQSDNIGEAI